MTAIVITKIKNKCIAASDRRISDARGEIYTDAHPKVQKVHGLLIGSAGDVAPFEIFLKLKCLKGLKDAADKMEYILFVIIPQFKRAMKTLVITDDDSVLGLFDTDIIICCKGKVYNIAINANHGLEVSPVSIPCGFGSGGTLALVAYKALDAYYEWLTSLDKDEGENTKLLKYQVRQTKIRLTEALWLAAEHDNSCDDNIDVIME